MEDERFISDEDSKIALEIFKKALGYRPHIKKAILGPEQSAWSEDEQLIERLTPRVAVHYFAGTPEIPFLYLRFVGEMAPMIEVFYAPYEAIYTFLSEARSNVRQISPPDSTNEEREKGAFDRAVEMTIIMIDSIYQRADLMMDSFIKEVIIEWHLHNRKNLQTVYAERGDPIPFQGDKSLEEAIKNYTKDVTRFWKSQAQTYESWQLFRLAEAYQAIYGHWKSLSKMSRDNENWRQYGKAGVFEDTPGDLLDRLENTDRLDSQSVKSKVSELAIEHAGRRVRLLKKVGISEAVKKQRRDGIRVTGYTSAQLFNLLRKGQAISGRVRAKDTTSGEQLTVGSGKMKSEN